MAVSAVALLCAGCAVPQPRGEGELKRIVEPTTHRPYWLYLPKEYVAADEAARAARAWPTVVTFHGMKPFDVASSQALEWEEEADRYGFVVVAPELMAFDSLFGEFPLRTINNAFKSDEAATMAILDHVFATTHADPSNVLSTSWSSGGYMAHYMLNRHPERFTCLGVRQSNFSASVLDSASTSRSLYHPILVLSTQNDFAICKEESSEAIKWYESHGYKNVAWVYINHLGHERTPDTAASFFARVCGAQPNKPPEVLMQRQAIDGNPAGLALLAGRMNRMQGAPGREPRPEPARPQDVRTASAEQRPTMIAASPAPRTTAVSSSGMPAPANPAPPPAPPTPKRSTRTEKAVGPAAPLGIRVSSAVGFEPLVLVYTAECPGDWYRSADFSWSLNGKNIGHGVNGQKTIADPGDYVLELLVVTDDGTEHRATHPVRVLKSIDSASGSPRRSP